MSIDTDKLEREADELFKNANEAPSLAEDTAESEGELNSENSEELSHSDESQDEEKEADKPPLDSIAEERIKNAQALMTKATQEAADLRRENTRLLEENEALKNSASNENTSTEVGSLDELMEEYPELVGPLIQRLNQLEGKISSIETVNHQSVEDSTLKAHWDAIAQAHPDHVEVSQDLDFQGWVARQAPALQSIAQNGSAKDVIYLLDQYKATSKNSDNRRNIDKLEQAKQIADRVPRTQTQPESSLKPSFTRDQIAKMTPDQFSKYEAEIDAAMARGEIL